MAAHPGFLLCTALLCLVTSQIGAAVDGKKHGREWLELLVLATGAMSIASVLPGGLAVGLFLRRADDPPDPSKGRGMGADQGSPR